MQAMAECIDALKLPAVRPYFTASVFLKMTKDMQGTISIPSFHHYIVRKNAMLQTVSTKALLLLKSSYLWLPMFAKGLLRFMAW